MIIRFDTDPLPCADESEAIWPTTHKVWFLLEKHNEQVFWPYSFESGSYEPASRCFVVSISFDPLTSRAFDYCVYYGTVIRTTNHNAIKIISAWGRKLSEANAKELLKSHKIEISATYRE